MVPVQSGSDKILGLMKRPYTRADINKIAEALNAINFKEWTTHLILGFPNETEEDFQASLDYVSTYKPKYVMASSFMETPGMEASKLDNKVPEEVVQERIQRLAEVMEKNGIICNYDNSEYAVKRIERRKAGNEI